MPGFDRTGPLGEGPMTGRRLGRCTGYAGDMPGRGYRGFGRGFRGGMGRGYGRALGFRWGNQFTEASPRYSDESLVENEARTLRNELDLIEKELEQLRKKKEE